MTTTCSFRGMFFFIILSYSYPGTCLHDIFIFEFAKLNNISRFISVYSKQLHIKHTFSVMLEQIEYTFNLAI